MDHPRFSVVTPSFNQGAYIERTIDSVLSQSYPNLEFIVIDGGSTDNSVDLIKKHEKYLTYWVSEPDRGQSHAINKGFQRATGQCLTWLNSDDWYVNNALKVFAEGFRSNPKSGMVVAAGTIVDCDGRVLHQSAPTAPINFNSLCGWMSGGMFMQPSAAISRAAWDACGPIDEAEHLAMDIDLWLRIAKAGFEFTVRPDHISEALSHANAKTTEFAEDSILACARVIAKHGSHRGYEDALKVMRDRATRQRRSVAWYKQHYDMVTHHPLVKLARPLAKRLGRDGGFWPERAPPWVKDI